MKSCPSCNRTFEDTFTFCLIDGSVLSAPFDPNATIRIDEVRDTEASPSEVLTQIGVRHNAELPSTVQASPVAYNPNVLSPPTSIPEQKPPETSSQKWKLWLKLILAIMFAPVISFVITLFVAVMIDNFTERSSEINKAYNGIAALTMFSTLVIQLILIYRWWRRKRREG